MKEVKKIILIAFGTMSAGLGIAGIFLPVLPTTPFLLLSALCFSKSSEKFHKWLLTSSLTGKYISNYLSGGGMSVRQKVISISLLWLTIGSTVIFIIQPLFVKIIILTIASAVTIHLLRIKTCKPEE
ncbi:YbaN family protein [Bacteroidota bacterium]